MKIKIIVLFLIMSSIAFSQEEKASKTDISLNKASSFPGGQQALSNFLMRNLKIPDNVTIEEVSKVYIGFVVAEDGSITEVRSLMAVNEELEKEGIRVVKSMPKWNPAIQNGKTRTAKQTLPIIFMKTEAVSKKRKKKN